MQFVLIFRKSHKRFTEAEQKRGIEEGRAWGARLLSEDRTLEVRQLGKEDHHIGPDGESSRSSVGEWPITAAVFFEASDFTEGVKIAETHPGVHYGMSIEVRPWTPPPAWPPAPAQ